MLEVQAAYRDEAMGVLRGELPPEERAEGHPTSDGIKGLQEFEPDLPTLQPVGWGYSCQLGIFPRCRRCAAGARDGAM